MKANQGFGTGFRAGVGSGLPGGTAYNPAALPDVVTSKGIPGPAASTTVTNATNLPVGNPAAGRGHHFTSGSNSSGGRNTTVSASGSD